MSYAHIIEVSSDPIAPEEYMDESTIWATHPWFIGEIADYFSDTSILDRDSALNEMAEFARGYKIDMITEEEVKTLVKHGFIADGPYKEPWYSATRS